MRVQVVLPRDYGHAIGGYAVAYEYANQLHVRGHQVDVVHLDPELGQRLRRYPRSEARKELARRRSGPDWYEVADGVTVRSVRSLGRRTRAADAVVATAWQTAEAVAACGVGAPQGFYLLQHDEVWSGPAERVHATWRLPLTKVVISGWLAELAEELDAGPAHRIPNGIDTDVFREHRPKAQRSSTSVAMMWHEADWKASATGLDALRLVKQRCPDLQVQLFSVYERPPDLPEWVTWRPGLRGRSLCDLYNECAVFVSPSLAEGWPLPPAEAMASGCCLVTTDIPGVTDYARAGTTALLAPPGDAAALADAVALALDDDTLRLRLAAAGQRLIHEEFSWARAGARFEVLLRETTGAAVPSLV